MAECRDNFGQGDKHEIALEHTRMRDLEFRRVDRGVIVEKNVEVDETRPFGKGFPAAHAGLHVTEGAEQRCRRKTGLGREDGVEKPGLVVIIDRFGFVNARKPEHMDARFGEEANGFAQVFFAIANVGAERQIDISHDAI